MPTYEYVCDKCGLKFDKVQTMSDQPLTHCPKELCGEKRWGKGRVKKLIGAGAGLIFKGSGFYITDYRSDKYKEAAKKDSGAAPAAASASGGEGKAAGGEGKASAPSEGGAKAAKPESKPASKPESKPAKPAATGKAKE